VQAHPGEVPTRFRVGTTSWTDASVIASGGFYPKGVKSAEQRLRHYASVFDTAEVDSGYYALPSARNALLWVERTPADFVFTIKAFRLFTHHQTPPEALPKDLIATLPLREKLPSPPGRGARGEGDLAPLVAELFPSPQPLSRRERGSSAVTQSPAVPGQKALDTIRTGPSTRRNYYLKDLPAEILDELWRRYLIGIEPLHAAGRLRAVLFQFAPWFSHGTASLDYLLRCQARLGPTLMAVEFRHASWFSASHQQDTVAFLRQHGMAHVVVDEPQGFANSVPQVWTATTPAFSVVRLHGRNRDAWNLKGLHSSADRFKYLYDDTELGDLHDHIRRLGQESHCVQVLFNNNYADWGVRNALRMQSLLRAGRADPVLA